MLAIIGLGNPGTKYSQNRHNVGFMMVDRLASHFGLSWKFDRQLEATAAKADRFILLKPQTFMNECGRVVGYLLNQAEVAPDEIWVVHDDTEVPFGQVRVKLGGSSAGHNGIKSIDEAIGADYWRLRVGIGRAPEGTDLSAYVLSDFSQTQKKVLPIIIDRVSQYLIESIEDSQLQAITFNAIERGNR